ncbi:MAG: energy-coupling factor transporter transmembrane component T [Proteobacteria bacterium]|nr:energy-coupling factor transporter transmembrane component T [Pseudomonadota bacterium]
MNISIYRNKNTWLHHLDPRTKLIGVIFLFIIALTFNHPLYVVFVIAGVLAIALSGKAMSAIWALRYILLLLILFSVLLWPFFVPGTTTIFAWKLLRVSRESLLYGIAMGLRLVTFIIAGLILLVTTKNEDITSGLIKMKLPYAVAFALSTALRLVPTFTGAGATIVQAQVSRGLDLESKNIFRRFKKLIPLAIPMFITSIRYTNFLTIALESRGFSPESRRTFYHEPRMTYKDWVILLFLACMMAFSLYLRLVLDFGAIIKGRL